MIDNAGKGSNTGATGGSTGARPEGGETLDVGKQSLVHQTFGVQRAPGKHGRDGEDDQAPPDPKRQNTGRGGGAAGFGYRIAKSGKDPVGSFAHDSSPAVANQVEPQPGSQETTAYLGNVITIGKGKDKTPVEVAQQYADEAFENPADAAQRFALVVGVNRMESVLESAGRTNQELDQQVTAVTGFQGFPFAAFRRTWRPTWVHDGTRPDKQDGEDATFEEVRDAAVSHGQEAARAERDKPSPPVGPMRTEVTQHPMTAQLSAKLKAHFASVYIHVGDADAVNLKAKATAASPTATGLFNRYDAVLADARKQGKNPLVVSGGYKFRVDDRFLPEEQRNQDPHAGEAGRVTPQTAASAELDMSVRHNLAGVDPSAVYMPEPNLLLRADAVKNANGTPRADFGKSNTNESLRLVDSLAKQPRGQKKVDRSEWAKENLVFDKSAGIYTDGKRFDEPMVEEPRYAMGGTDVPGLTHPTRNKQSIARVRQLGNAIAHMNGNVTAVLNVFLPQKLVDLEREQQQGGVTQTTLEAVRRYLSTFEVIAGGIKKDIDELTEVDEIPARPQKDNVRGMSDAEKKAAEERHKAALQQHEEAAVGLGETYAKDRAGQYADFMTAGMGSTEQLSQKLVLATSAAKTFKNAKDLGRILQMCRAASIAVGEFLSTFYPEGAAITASVAATAQPTASTSTARSPTAPASSSDAMQVDSP